MPSPANNATGAAPGTPEADLNTPGTPPSTPPNDRLDLEIPNSARARGTKTDGSQADIVESNQLSSDQDRIGLRSPLEEARLKQFDRIKTKDQACKEFEGKIVTYYDQTNLIERCRQRPIEDPEFLNEMVHGRGKKVVEVPARVYRLIPFGQPYGREDRFARGAGGGRKPSQQECNYLNRKYVTVSGMTYYFVEGCKKRPFADYYELQAHSAGKAPIVTITPEMLARLPEGVPMKAKANEEAKILYEIDGDVVWSRLARKEGEKLPSDTPDSLSRIKKKSAEKVDKSALCSKYNRKVVSFYSQIFFIEGCKKRPIAEMSIALQQRIDDSGGVSDLTPEQMLAIPEGKQIAEKDVLKAMR